MDDEIKVGDTVRLKSGSPLMTVGGIRDDALSGEVAICHRFDGIKAQEKCYPVEALEKTSSLGRPRVVSGRRAIRVAF